MKSKILIAVACVVLAIIATETVHGKLPNCYWTGCVEFNRANCRDDYELMTKEKCGDWWQRLSNHQRKYCCINV
jgi:hypothetical protein